MNKTMPVCSLRFDPFVPYKYFMGQIARAIGDIRHIHETAGLRRFYLCGPTFSGVMYAPFPDDLYARMGAEFAEVKRALADTDIELGWWCTPSIRYVSDFEPIQDAWGNKSIDNKKCPLDPAFQADWAAKIKSVAAAMRPTIINIEDDYTLGWGRGLKSSACYCPRHLAAFAYRYGQTLPGPAIAAAFENRTPENLAIRRAFADTVRESLCELARRVRAAVDEVDPSIRIGLCEAGANSDKDGDALEAVARAFAGPHTRPAVRPAGAIYGAQTTPADIPPAIGHTLDTLERLPKDIETFYEADPYPHNRFYTSASQMISLMSGALFMGSQNIQFYCLQNLDDPLEDTGYVDAYQSMKPRLERVRGFISARKARLAGVRLVWRTENISLNRGGDGDSQLVDGAFLCAKMGFPYTTRKDAKGSAILAGDIVHVMTDEDLLAILSGGVFVDAPAAALLSKRGFGGHLGVEVKLAEERLPIITETILPASGCQRRGKSVNAFHIFNVGTEGTIHTFATLTPHVDTEIWSEFSGIDGKVVTPSLTMAANSLGGRVAVFAVSLLGNRNSGLYNLRRQEQLRNLFNRLAPETLPVVAVDAPGIWTMAQVAEDEKSMLVMVNNLSGDVRSSLAFAFSREWTGAAIARLDENGEPRPLGVVTSRWSPRLAFAQMQPEFFVVDKLTV